MKVQNLINEMHTGNTAAITQGIHSENPLLRLNAIAAGTKLGLKENRFLDGLRIARNSEASVLGFSVRKFAVAALDVLGEETYQGSDEQIRELIQVRFDVSDCGGDLQTVRSGKGV